MRHSRAPCGAAAGRTSSRRRCRQFRQSPADIRRGPGRRCRARRGGGTSAADHGQRRLLRAARFGRFHAAAMARHDAVELDQSLDLLDDHAAHLRGGLGGLLRHFENDLAQFGAGVVELALHLGGHFLDALENLRNALGGLLENGVGVAHRLLVDALHRILGALAFLLGAVAHQLELLGDGLRALCEDVSAIRWPISRARAAELSSDSSSRVEKRFRRCSSSSLLMSRVAIIESKLARRSSTDVVGLAVAGVDHLDRLHQRAAVAVELRWRGRRGPRPHSR